MIEIPDSHCHLDMEDFTANSEEVLIRARTVGVSAFLCPAEISDTRGAFGSPSTWRPAIPTSRPPRVSIPHQAKLFSEARLSLIRALAEDKKITAVGEIGLDFHYDFASPARTTGSVPGSTRPGPGARASGDRP